MKRKVFSIIVAALIFLSLIACNAEKAAQTTISNAAEYVIPHVIGKIRQPFFVPKITIPSKVPEFTCPRQLNGKQDFLVKLEAFDKNSVIVIDENYDINNFYHIYRVNVADNTYKLIYSGHCPGDRWKISVKRHTNGTYSFLFNGGIILVFDQKTDELIKKIDVRTVNNPGVLYFDISNNGEKVVYTNAEGVCISDLDLSDTTIIYKAGERDYLWPLFSKGDSKIVFIINNDPDIPTDRRKYVILDIRTEKAVAFDCDAIGLIMMENGFIILRGHGTDWYYDFNANGIKHLPIYGEHIFVMQDYIVYWADQERMILNIKSDEVWSLSLNIYGQSKYGNTIFSCYQVSDSIEYRARMYDVDVCVGKKTSEIPIEPVVNTGY